MTRSSCGPSAWISTLLCFLIGTSVLAPGNAGAEELPSEPVEKETASSPFSQSKFVPDISLILDVTYVQRTRKDETYSDLARPEYTPAPSDKSAHGDPEDYSPRGFNLNYAEITFFSVIDPYFDLFAVCEVKEDGITLEEGYFTTRGLPLGLQVKAGKFLSHFGRINEQHAHYWDFHDIPLVYDAFFGQGALDEVGARVTCVIPADFYLMAGAEILQGANERSFGSESFTNVDGTLSVDGSNGPNLYTGYVKTSFDIGDFIALAGASGAFGETRKNNGLDRQGESGSADSADTYILGGDITLKYQIDSVRQLTLQAEYLFKNMDGTRYRNDAADVTSSADLHVRQSGLYAQIVAKPAKRWRLGARYDLLQLNDVREGDEHGNVPDDLPRYSAMLEFNPTEFSRLRLQYNYDRSLYATDGDEHDRTTNHEIILQANMAIGAHGAHSF